MSCARTEHRVACRLGNRRDQPRAPPGDRPAGCRAGRFAGQDADVAESGDVADIADLLADRRTATASGAVSTDRGRRVVGSWPWRICQLGRLLLQAWGEFARRA
jgi:hypothetical protein